MKRYIIEKRVMAESAEEAIKKEKRQKVDGVWIDKDYIEPTNQNIIKIIEDMPKTFPIEKVTNMI